MTAEHTVQAFPSGAVLPENLLRMHVFFDEAPNVDTVARAVRLLGEDGHEIAHPFLDLHDGLWGPSGTRLTLLFHPGRIKSGLAAHAAQGLSLHTGRAHRLVLDLGLLFDDASPAANLHKTTFSVGHALETAVDVAVWTIRAPTAGSLEAVRLEFDRVMDRLNLEHLFSVVGPHGEHLPFSLVAGEQEREVLLAPAQRWAHVGHHIQISNDPEDVAGNRVARAFEQIGATLQWPAPPTLGLPFTPTHAE
jgi:hypothetical protein